MLAIKITLLVINVILWMVLFGAGFEEKIGILAVAMEVAGAWWCFKQGDYIMGLLFAISIAIAIIALFFLGMIWAIIDDIFNITNDE